MGRGDGLRLWPQETLEGIGVVTDAGVLVATTHRLVLPVVRRGGGIENTHKQTDGGNLWLDGMWRKRPSYINKYPSCLL